MTTTETHDLGPVPDDDSRWLDEHLPEDESQPGPDAMDTGYRAPVRPVDVTVGLSDDAGAGCELTLQLTRDQGDDDAHIAQALVQAVIGAAGAFRLRDPEGMRVALRAEMAVRSAPTSGSILAAWRQIVTLVGADRPLPLSPASVVDRVAMAVEQQTPAALRPRETVTGAEAVALPPGSVFRTPGGELTMVRIGDEVYAAGASTVCHPDPSVRFDVLHRETKGPTS